MNVREQTTYWENIAIKQLVGRKIVNVRYMNDAEAEEYGWYNRPVINILDEGNIIFPSADDEGNDGGAIFTNDDKQPVLPVLRF